MAGRLIDEPRLKSLIETIEQVVRDDGMDEKLILPSESFDTVVMDAVTEITSNVAEFDNWYFDDDTEIMFKDERKERLARASKKSADNSKLATIVQEVVEYTLEAMREVDDLQIEPDVAGLTSHLVQYIVNWKDWYPEYKIQRTTVRRFENSSLNEEIYFTSDYNKNTDSQGQSNIYDDDDIPLDDPADDLRIYIG